MPQIPSTLHFVSFFITLRAIRNPKAPNDKSVLVSIKYRAKPSQDSLFHCSTYLLLSSVPTKRQNKIREREREREREDSPARQERDFHRRRSFSGEREWYLDENFRDQSAIVSDRDAVAGTWRRRRRRRRFTVTKENSTEFLGILIWAKAKMLFGYNFSLSVWELLTRFWNRRCGMSVRCFSSNTYWRRQTLK